MPRGDLRSRLRAILGGVGSHARNMSPKATPMMCHAVGSQGIRGCFLWYDHVNVRTIYRMIGVAALSGN